MARSSRLTFEEFIALSSSPSEDCFETRHSCSMSASEENKDSYYYCEDKHGNIPPPSREAIDRFIGSGNDFSSLSSYVTSSRPVLSKHSINYTNPNDYVENWHLLSNHEKVVFRKLVLSDTTGNSNRFGLKRKNLETHLLLSLGCDTTNIVSNGKDSILTNLKNPVDLSYSKHCLDNRTLDPKTCLRAYRKFNNHYDVESLFSTMVCFQAVILQEDKKYSSAELMKKDYQLFFKSNASFFSRMLNKKKCVSSYIYSNEISVDSILCKKYRPHTHLVFFLEKEKNRESLFERAKLCADYFNKHNPGKHMSILTSNVDHKEVPKLVSSYKDISKMINYLHNCYSLAETYMREIREDNIPELNHNTKECYRELVWLFKKDTAALGKVNRVGCARIPKKKAREKKEDSLLQNESESTTIKQEKSKSDSRILPYEQQPTGKRNLSKHDRRLRGRSSRAGDEQRGCNKDGNGSSSGSVRKVHARNQTESSRVPEGLQLSVVSSRGQAEAKNSSSTSERNNPRSRKECPKEHKKSSKGKAQRYCTQEC
jgi:hypothetical protein